MFKFQLFKWEIVGFCEALKQEIWAIFGNFRSPDRWPGKVHRGRPRGRSATEEARHEDRWPGTMPRERHVQRPAPEASRFMDRSLDTCPGSGPAGGNDEICAKREISAEEGKSSFRVIAYT